VGSLWPQRRLRAVALAACFALLAAGAAAFDSDDFDRANLDTARWSVVDPLGDGWLRIVGAGTGDAHAELSVPAGPSHDPWGAVNKSFRIMQPIADVDFQLEAVFDSDPALRYQLQGVIVEATPTHWLRFDVRHDGSSQRVFAAVTVSGSSSSRFDFAIATGAARRLRVSRSGDDWTLEIAGDDAIYTTAGTFDHALAVASAGVFAANHDGTSGGSPAYTAVVDFVFDTSAPIVPEDGGAAPDTLPPLIQAVDSAAAGSELTVSFFTDEPAQGTVDYGPTTAYELGSLSNAGGTTSHVIALPGMVPGQTVHFRVRAEDALAQESQSADFEVLFDPDGPEIDVWYGDPQPFGQLGQPQPFVNLLGNVSDSDGVASLDYALNGAPPVSLSLGPDGRRLVNSGDFNVDLDVADLLVGANTLLLTAIDGVGNSTQASVQVDYQSAPVWPLPYTVDWSLLAADGEIQSVAQVVDGRWRLDAGALRTDEPGYDRLVAIGDGLWTGLEVTVPIVRHDSPGGHGVGVLFGWNGHTDSPVVCAQPKCGWLPLGAILWARPSSLEIYGNGGATYDSTSRTLVDGTRYWFKARAEPGASGTTYRLRVWEDGQPEPATWDVEGQGGPGDPQQGSILLITHKADVSFGNPSISEVQPPANTPPVAANDARFVAQNGSVLVDVLTNDLDPDGALDPASVAIVTPPAHGIATPVPLSGDIVYDHDGSATLSDTFSYTVDDTLGATSNVATVSITIGAGPPAEPVSDDFNRPSLEPMWTIEDPLGDNAFAVVGAGSGDALLSLSLPAGSPHDAWGGGGGGNEAIRAMQPAPDVDFEVELKWASEPTDGYNDQGLLVEQDADDWLRFDVFHTGSALKLFVGKTVGGSHTAVFNQSIASGSALYLRVRREGNTWTTFTSSDGASWIQRHQFDHALAVSRVGVYAANPIAGLAFISELDYFENTALGLANEDVNTLSTNVVGSGTVVPVPDQLSYAGGEQIDLSASPSAGWSFAGWSGDASGLENPTLLVVTGAMQVTATFAPTVPGPGALALGALIACLVAAGRGQIDRK